MKIEAFFIDADDTLYPNDSGLWAEIRNRIFQFVALNLGVSTERAKELTAGYMQEYGATYRGLIANYPEIANEYFRVVHDIDLGRYIKPDPELKDVLNSINARKYILTNADAGHATRVLEALKIKDCFSGVIDIHALEPTCKPNKEAFDKAMKIASVADPRACVFIDDLVQNVKSAAELGMFSILFGEKNVNTADYIRMTKWSELPNLLGANGYER